MDKASRSEDESAQLRITGSRIQNYEDSQVSHPVTGELQALMLVVDAKLGSTALSFEGKHQETWLYDVVSRPPSNMTNADGAQA